MIARIALVLLWAAPALAGPLALEVRTGLVLGDDTTAALHLRAGAAVHLVTDAGSIDVPVPDGDRLRATWTLPTEHRPQLALIAAVADDGTVVDWIAVSLAGRARIKVETAPRASVIVDVEGTRFGPVVANAQGVAQVPVVVPPGITEATATSTTATGNTTEKRISLGAPPVPRVLVLCADRVVVVAAALDGAPSTLAPDLTLGGAPTAMRAVGPGVPGVFEAPIGDSTVTAVAAFDGIGASASCDAAPRPPAADGLDVIASIELVAPQAPRIEVPAPIAHHLAIAITAGVGYLSNFGRVAAPIGTITAEARVLPQLAVGLDLGVYRAGFDAAATDETIATRVTAMPILARAAYVRPVARFELAAGAGLGVAIVSTQLTSPSVDTMAATQVTFAAAVFAAAATHVGPGRIVLEARYLNATIGGDVSGRVGGLAITAGYGFEL